MTWNYRIVRYYDTDECYGLHEVYYDDHGVPTNMTQDPATFEGDSPGDVVDALRQALRDAENLPVFKEPEEWAKPHFGEGKDD